MIDRIIFFGFLTLLVMFLMMAAAVVIGSSWYDARRLRQAKRRGPKPTISAVIVTDNHEAHIRQCLESVLASTHKKIEIIVVDNVSRDRTRAVAKEMMREYRYAAIKLVAKRKRSSFEVAARAGIAHASGNLLLVIDGDSLLDSDTLEMAATHFSPKNQVNNVELNQRVLSSPSLFGLLQQFDTLGRFYMRKLTSLLRIDRRQTIYESHAIVRLQPAASLTLLRKDMQATRAVTLVRSMLEVAAVVYFLYAAYSLGDALLLTTAVLGLIVYFVFAIWTAERMALSEKLRFTFLVPSAGILFLLQSFVKCTKLLPGVKKLTESPASFVYSNKR